MRIVRLEKRHVRDRFRCGEPELDAYLASYARQNDRRDLTRTYVATEDGDDRVLGFVSVRVGAVACSVLPEDARRRLPAYPVPVLHLARLAVDDGARGRGIGERLLVHALRKALVIADEAGLYGVEVVGGVEVVAKGARARAFYERYGFAPLVDDPFHLYLGIGTVRKASGQSPGSSAR